MEGIVFDGSEGVEIEKIRIRRRLATNINLCRRLKGMTRTELAEKLGVTPGAIGHYERGIRSISAETVLLIADAFGVSADSLLRLDRKDILKLFA